MALPKIQKIILLLSLFNISCAHPVHSEKTNAINKIDVAKNKTVFCQGCHGKNGNSANPKYPNLAGQRTSYIEAQLKAFKSGLRSNDTMQSMADNLTTQDVKSLAVYFSGLTTKSAGGDPFLAKKGKQKYTICTGCHGIKAQGRSGFPKLAGQHPEYLKKQLLSFKWGFRKANPMNAMTASLSEQDINEIAAYLGSL